MTRKLLLFGIVGFLAISLYLAGFTPVSEAQDLSTSKCTICHAKQTFNRMVKQNGKIADLLVTEDELSSSVHHNRTCTDCHADILTVPHENYTPQTVDCARCHFSGNPVGAPQKDVSKAFAISVHGQALAAGKENAPRCQDCHGSHSIKPRNAPDGPFSPQNIAITCGRCHKDQYRDWRNTVHGTALIQDNKADAPDCISCHGEHDIFNKDDERSRVHRTKLADDCGQCHAAKEITSLYGVPEEQVATFKDSFHGIAIKFGSQVAASCSSCHGYHNILPSSDPASSVNVKNIPATCGQQDCHPGAGENFAKGKVHISAHSEESGVLHYIALGFSVLTISVLVGLGIHIILDLIRRFMGPRGKDAKHAGGEEHK